MLEWTPFILGASVVCWLIGFDTIYALQDVEFDKSAGLNSLPVKFGPKTWSFPKEDCAALPIANTTTELLAKWFAGRLAAELEKQYGYSPEVMRVEVEEATGQSATFAITR